jgi:hypothetical protein
MALWGKTADVAMTGTGSITQDTDVLTGAGTAFTTELEVQSTISVGGTTFLVTAINSDTEILVAPDAAATLTAQALLTSDSPKYVPAEDIAELTYVQVADINPTSRLDGIKTPGWTLYEEYGTGRKRVEVLVAMKNP